jgi:hypothetical protein
MHVQPSVRRAGQGPAPWIGPACVLLLACGLVLLGPLAARAEDTLRCGSRLVSIGDGKDKVRSLCGEPTSISFAGMIGRPGYDDRPYDYWYFPPAWVELPVEVWTYNLGPTRLLRKLRFVGDELDRITTEGHGY